MASVSYYTYVGLADSSVEETLQLNLLRNGPCMHVCTTTHSGKNLQPQQPRMTCRIPISLPDIEFLSILFQMLSVLHPPADIYLYLN
jgi:hypothetical protein